MENNNYETMLEQLKIVEGMSIEQCMDKLNSLSSECDNLELSEDRKELLYFDVKTEAAKQFYNEIFEGLTFNEYVDLFNVISEDYTDIAPLLDKINDVSKEYTIFINTTDKKFKCELK